MEQILIENARLVDPARDSVETGSLLIKDGVIAAISTTLGSGASAKGNLKASAKGNANGNDTTLRIDAKGLVLAPGIVDMRVQLREPGEEHKETIRSGVAAAMAGGVTSMVCLPSTEPIIDDVSVVQFVARRGREEKGTKVYCYAAATQGLRGEQISEMGLLQKSGALGFTDAERSIQDSRVMTRVLRYARGLDALVVQHPEDRSLAEGGDMNQGRLADRLGLVGIPAEAEAIIVDRDIRLLRGTGGRCHFAHLTTRASIAAVRAAKRDGLNVSCDTAPQYFCLTEEALTGYRTFAKVTPPLRSEDDRQAVIAGLLDGTIDCIASDHSPQDQDSKRIPLPLADCGMIGLETLFALSVTYLHDLSLPQIFRKLSSNPAALLRIEGGLLEVGKPADLLLCDPDRTWKIEEERMRSKSKNTPFQELEVRGLVMKTFVDGRLVFDREQEEAQYAAQKARGNARENASKKAELETSLES